MTTFRAFLGLCCATLLAAPVVQAGDPFTAGDLYLHTPAATGISSLDGGVLRIDPVSGTTELVLDLAGTYSSQGGMAYDTYREGLLLMGRVGGPLEPVYLWLMDATGQLQNLGHQNLSYRALAPRGDGTVYFRQGGTTADQVRYIDRFNVLHTVMDTTGSLPLDIAPSGNAFIYDMHYDVATNALFAAVGSGLGPACGGGGGFSTGVTVYRIPLSVDGTQAAGPVSCSDFEVSSSGETVAQITAGPGGDLVLVVDTNSNGPESRMLLVDPVTLVISSYAVNDHVGAAGTNAGLYSTALSKVVILDTGNDVLRAFAQGELGTGQIVTTSMPVSPAGSSGEIATLVEVPGGGCDGFFTVYGAGLAGAGGFVPQLWGTGCSEIGKAITVEIDDVRGGTFGALFVSAGQAAIPFKGGTLLVDPILLMLDIVLGGFPNAPGDGSLSIPAVLPNDPLLVGFSVFTQGAFADAGALNGVSLSNGLEIGVG